MPQVINSSRSSVAIVFKRHFPIDSGITKVILLPRIFLSCKAASVSWEGEYGQSRGKLNFFRISKILPAHGTDVHAISSAAAETIAMPLATAWPWLIR